MAFLLERPSRKAPRISDGAERIIVNAYHAHLIPQNHRPRRLPRSSSLKFSKGAKFRRYQRINRFISISHPAKSVAHSSESGLEFRFVGDQTPSIALDAAGPHGIRQAGLGLVKGKAYVGRVVLKGMPGAHVKVALVWGPDASDRASVDAGTLTAAYRTIPLRFTADADATDAALEITGIGSGSFHVGAVSLMPPDNVEGFRPDTIALLREIKSALGT